MSEQANSTRLTDNLLILNFRVLQCKMVASLVQQTVAFVSEPVKSKLIISQMISITTELQLMEMTKGSS